MVRLLNQMLGFLILALVLLFVACSGGSDVEEIDSVEESQSAQEDPLTVKLDEWQEDCPPNPVAAESTGDKIDSPIEMYALKVRVETTSIWTSVEVDGLESITSMYALTQGDEEINLQMEGLEIYEISRPEDGKSVGEKIVLEIDTIAQKQGDTGVFRISKENSGTTTYILLNDNGNTIDEIARFTNSKSDDGDNAKTFTLDLDTLTTPLISESENPYDGPLFDTHAHLVGSKDIKHTYAEDDRLHINPERADEIFAALEDENVIGLIGFLPVLHEYFVNDDSFNQHYQNGTMSVVSRPDNIIIPFLHPNSHIGIPPKQSGHKLADFIERNVKETDIPFKGIGEIHTSYPQTDSYEDMRMVDTVMLELYDYAAANDLIVMIHPELIDMEDVHEALDHNPNTIFLLHGIIDSGAGGQPIAELLDTLFEEHQNVYFSVDAALMLGYGLMDSCMYDKEQFIANLHSELVYRGILASSVAFWKPVIDAHPTRIMWGTDFYYWWHYEPDVIHEVARFGRDFITQLDSAAQERFAYRNALDMLRMPSD